VSGPAGFLVIPCAPGRLRDPNAVFWEEAKTILHLIPTAIFRRCSNSLGEYRFTGSGYN
jgi:hypothetical protein